MYIHLGDNFVVPSKEVVMILDYSTSKSSPIITEFLEKQDAEMNGISGTDTKSIVVTVDKIYFSSLASGTLKKRAQTAFDIDFQTGK